MRRVPALLVVLTCGVAGALFGIGDARPPSSAAAPLAVADDPDVVVAAAPGRVEAWGEEVSVASEIDGRLIEVAVDEGDTVVAGQVIARIEDSRHVAQVAAAEAEVQLREALARRVRNGAREEERREAGAALNEADAVLEQEKHDLDRLRRLGRAGVISAQELDRGEKSLAVAQARRDAAEQRARLLNAAAREEDQARADAEVALARAQLDEARAVLAKTIIRSPIDGIVLRRHRRAGEGVSTSFDTPIVTLANRTHVRVRVEVDETDVARIALGQPAYVTADAFGDRRFTGRIVRIGPVVGRKRLRTDEPTERIDTKVLETLLDLDDGAALPLGLRVRAFLAPARATG